jgi:DNA-binding transcriptional LysR family regulator
MNITLRQLHGFRMVAEAGSFTRAAQRLKIAQPALSLLIRDLESELSVRLFDRTTRRVELTAAGREFLRSVDKLIADLEHAVRGAREWNDAKRGRAVIAAPPFLAATTVPSAIADYKRSHPGVDVRLIDAQTNVIVEKVRSGEADLGIGTFSKSEEGIRREILFEDALMAFASPRLALVRAPRMSWTELRNGPLIALTEESEIRQLTNKAFENIGLPIRPAYEVSHITTAVMLVEAGLGVSVLPAYAWGFARSFDIVSKPLVEPTVNREVVIIRSDARSLSPPAEKFTHFIRKRVRSALPRNMRPK